MMRRLTVTDNDSIGFMGRFNRYSSGFNDPVHPVGRSGLTWEGPNGFTDFLLGFIRGYDLLPAINGPNAEDDDCVMGFREFSG